MRLSALYICLPLVPAVLGTAHGDLHAQARSRSAHRALVDKRQVFSGTATWFAVGLGACGGYNGPGDFIVALNGDQFGEGYPGPQCGRSLRISYGGKTAIATVADKLPQTGSNWGHLDLSRGLFSHFEQNLDVGTLDITWTWADQAENPPPPPPPSSTAEPTHSTTPPPPPPSSSAEPTSSTTTTTSSTPSSTSTSSSSSITSITSTGPPSSSSTAPSSSAASISASQASGSIGDVIATDIPHPSDSARPSSANIGAPGGTGNLVLLNQAVANLGRVVVVGAQT